MLSVKHAILRILRLNKLLYQINIELDANRSCAYESFLDLFKVACPLQSLSLHYNLCLYRK